MRKEEERRWRKKGRKRLARQDNYSIEEGMEEERERERGV